MTTTEAQCTKCGGSPVTGCINGHLVFDDLTADECPNLTKKRRLAELDKRLLPELRGVPLIHGGPLYTPRKKRTDLAPPIDLTNSNVLIQCASKANLLPHLKLVLMCKPNMKVTITDDEVLKDVYLGGKSYQHTAKDKRDVDETFNVISDLIGKEYDLAVICLGWMGYKNVAMPGILREALMIREACGKPTWLLQSHDKEWVYSRDVAVDDYIGNNYEIVTLDGEAPPPRPTNIIVDEYEPTGEAEVPQQKSFIQTEQAPPDLDDMMSSMPGHGKQQKKKFGNRW